MAAAPNPSQAQQHNLLTVIKILTPQLKHSGSLLRSLKLP